jgi:hypothetical protein
MTGRANETLHDSVRIGGGGDDKLSFLCLLHSKLSVTRRLSMCEAFSYKSEHINIHSLQSFIVELRPFV